MSYIKYLDQVKRNKTRIKIFLTNKTMLSGFVQDYDDDSIIIDKCLVMREQIISIDHENK